MKTKLNFRSVVFKRAYLIVKKTGVSFSEALKQAWQRYREYRNKVVEEFTSQINNFDFHYHYSDDNRVYKYWSSIQQNIKSELASYPGSFINAISMKLTAQEHINQFV